MEIRRIKRFRLSVGIILALLFLLFGGMSAAFGASPSGVLKTAIHWRISADELDPAYSLHGVGITLPLYLFHDSLVKVMPEGVYTPCLAESWTVSPDA